jgi:hypothetical protein
MQDHCRIATEETRFIFDIMRCQQFWTCMIVSACNAIAATNLTELRELAEADDEATSIEFLATIVQRPAVS